MNRNAYYINGKLDRQYLRTSAVYRCLMRYGVSKEWAVQKCDEVFVNPKLARALVEGWISTRRFQNLASARWRGEGDGRDEAQVQP